MKRVVAVLILLVCPGCGTREPTGLLTDETQAARDSAFVTGLRARLAAATAAGEFSGAVLVAHDGRTLFEGAYGLADRELGVPNTPLTQFRGGSMDKMLTAVATLQLVQAGMLRLHAPIGAYLQDYPNAEVASQVTPHHLLTHTGGTGDIFGPGSWRAGPNSAPLLITSISTARAVCGSRRMRASSTATTGSCCSVR